MSEEEKKAIEMIEIIVDECKLENKRKGYEGTYYDGDTPIPYKEYGIISNLITKLQKEVEHQKEKRENQKEELAILNEKQKEMNKLINDVKTYKGQFKRQEKEIKKLQKENEEKNKQINLMAEYIATLDIEEDICMNNKINSEWCNEDYTNCKKCIKQYFERKVKNVKNKR